MSRKARIRNRIILAVFLTILVVWGLYSLAMNEGKDLIVDYLKGYFNREVNIESLNIIPPFRLDIEEIAVEDLFKIKRIIVSPSIVGMLLGRIAFNDIVLLEPEVNLKRSREGKLNLALSNIQIGKGFSAEQNLQNQSLETSKARAKKRLFIIGNLHVRGGILTFIDSKISEQGFKIIISDINILASKLSLSALPMLSRFTANANLYTSEGNKGSIDFSGWVNLFKKDMEVKLNLLNLDLALLYPYYSYLLGLNVKSGILDAEINLQSKNNNLNITYKFIPRDFLFKESISEDFLMLSVLSHPIFNPTASFLIGSKSLAAFNFLNPILFSFLESGRQHKAIVKGKFVPFEIEQIDYDYSIIKKKMEDLFRYELQTSIGQSGSVVASLEDFEMRLNNILGLDRRESGQGTQEKAVILKE